MAELELAINEALDSNQKLSDLLDAAKAEGFNVNMNCMLVLGDDQIQDDKRPAKSKKAAKAKKTKMSKDDIKFLNELGIKW